MGISRLTGVVLLAMGCISAPGVLWSQQPVPSGAPPSKPGTVKSSQPPDPEDGKSRDASKPLKSPDGQQGDVVILSDTMGVDFGPYVQPMVPEIRKNWLRLMPESARSPVSKSGQVAMEFAILKDGRVTGLTMKVSSGDDALDRAVRSAILESRPFSPLPSIFRGQYLLLRMTFHYNSSTTPQTPPAGAPSGKAARPDGTVSPKNL